LTTGGRIPNSNDEALHMQALAAKAQTIRWRREWPSDVNPRERRCVRLLLERGQT
jgi:hypothetical protein